MKTPFLRATLAISVLATQCLFAYEPEKNIWAERKAACQKMGRGNNRSDSGLLAISTTRGAGRTESLNDLLVKFSPAAPFNFSAPQEIARPSINREVPRTGFPLSKADSARLPPSILAYGSIREIHLAKNPGAPLIIHIQDAHDSEEAQKNMAALIQILQEERGIHLIGLEGAQGAFALEPYRAYPEKMISRSLAAYFLKRGDIGGPEYVGLTAPKAPLLWGVEETLDFKRVENERLDLVEKLAREIPQPQLTILGGFRV